MCLVSWTLKLNLEDKVEEMLEDGIIRPSQSSYCALVVMVLKKEGSWCMFLDYRELKKITIKHKFLIPLLMNF